MNPRSLRFLPGGEALIEAGFAAANAMREVLEPHELEATQYFALLLLRKAAPRKVSVGELEENMPTKQSDMTRMLDKLDRLGLIQRRRSDEDRRVVLAWITPKGAHLLREVQPQLDKRLRLLFRDIDPRFFRELAKLPTRAGRKRRKQQDTQQEAEHSEEQP